MRASELLRRPVRTPSGRPLGVVHDVRLRRHGDEVEVSALLVGPDRPRVRASYASGVTQGRTTGPTLVRRMLTPRDEQMRVEVGEVLVWSDGGGVVVAESVGGDRPGGAR